jgi:uncharacterized protein YebE (UPF0316 family)
MKNRETLKYILSQIIERKLESNQPPEITQAYYRLTETEAFTDEEARMLISRALEIELFKLMRFAEPFNMFRFKRNLKRLPELPALD